MSKIIPLTRGFFATVDDADFDWLNQWKWTVLTSGPKHFYAYRKGRKCEGLRHKKTIRMHREILDAPDSMEVDHINGDGLDNRRINLRLCDRYGQTRNARLAIDNSSGYKGVYFHRASGKWMARLHGKYLGLHLSSLEAAIAYDRAADKYFGSFARTNQSLGLI